MGGVERSLKERTMEAIFFLCAALSVFVTLAIITTLTIDAIDFFTQVAPAAFFLGDEWIPPSNPSRSASCHWSPEPCS